MTSAQMIPSQMALMIFQSSRDSAERKSVIFNVTCLRYCRLDVFTGHPSYKNIWTPFLSLLTGKIPTETSGVFCQRKSLNHLSSNMLPAGLVELGLEL